MQRTICTIIVAILLAFSPSVRGQDQRAELQKRLDGLFKLTHMTADNSDIVTAGSVLVLRKDGLLMCSVQAKVPITNSYKGDKLSAGKFAWALALGMAQPGVQVDSIPMRQFVAGEKFWLTAILAEKSGVMLRVVSDPFQDVRYYAQLSIPFNKKAMPSDDEILKSVAEIVSSDSSQEAAQPPQNTPPPPTQAPMQPIAPPPPPTDAPAAPPKSIKLGQTKDQVVAILGAPQKTAAVGEKEILYYPDMKIILVKGKVTDVQ